MYVPQPQSPQCSFNFITYYGIKIYIADRDLKGAEALAEEPNKGKDGQVGWPVQVDVPDWDSQRKSFEALEAQFSRIDYVYPIVGIGNRRYSPNRPHSRGCKKPDVVVLEVDAIGVFYAVSLALQHFRRQERIKPITLTCPAVVSVASFCGFYILTTVPMYTAAKHAVVGFVRSLGMILPKEKLTLNAARPNKIRTNLSTEAIYKMAEQSCVLIPMDYLLEAFVQLLGLSDSSGGCFEIAPKIGCCIMPPTPFVNEESRISAEMAYERSHYLHEPIYE